MILNNKILERINLQEAGWVFCAKDFHDFSSRNNIDKILSLLAFEKKIMRIGRGIYYYPEIDKSGEVIPFPQIKTTLPTNPNHNLGR